MRSLLAMDDAALITAHRTGDSRAMSALMDRHGGTLMGFLVARAGQEAEDIYQETWTRVATGLPAYDERGSFRAWLFQIARRQLIDQHRRKRARVQLVLTDLPSAPPRSTAAQPDEALAARDVTRTLNEALQSMDPAMAEVVRLRLLEGVPFNEIARRQDIPLNTALGRMHRGLKRIRSELIAAGLLQEGST
jgi:RNA polymerase sigma-70 factor (ECF subfamily)